MFLRGLRLARGRLVEKPPVVGSGGGGAEPDPGADNQ
jgi:hypothetical protein